MNENNPILTVRVIKADPDYWYADYIGQTFKVFRHDPYYFILGYDGMLSVDDCEVVE